MRQADGLDELVVSHVAAFGKWLGWMIGCDELCSEARGFVRGGWTKLQVPLV